MNRPDRSPRSLLLTTIATTTLIAISISTSGCGLETDRGGRAAAEQAVDDADATPQHSGNPVGPDTPLDELLAEMLDRWRGLDQRVIDEDAVAPLAAIEEVWALAEPIIRADHQGALFGFQQAVDLARSAVERTRPADASKGYRLARDLTTDLLER